MALSPFTLPPTRVVGGPNPPGDMNQVVLAVNAGGTYYNVMNAAFAGGGDPTGVADSTAAINAMITTIQASGGKGYLPAGTYKTTATIDYTGVTLVGDPPWPVPGQDLGTVLVPTSAVTGSVLQSSCPNTASATTIGGQLFGIGIDGSNLGGTVAGIYAVGATRGGVIEGCFVYKTSGNGIDVSSANSNASGSPLGWHVNRVKIDTPGGAGVSMGGHTDSQWYDVHVINAASHGWLINASPSNTRMIGCRSEWSTGGDGYHLTGAWNTGTGSGPFVMSACSTDRNQMNGFYCNATGNAPAVIDACMFRRDGRNGGTGGAGYAGIQGSAATMPLFFNAVNVWPGVDDNGSGTNSPQYGASVTSSTTVQILSGYLQGATAGTNGTTASAFLIAPNVIVASGSTGGPTTQLTDFYRQASGILQTDNAIQAPNSFISAQRFNPGGITGATASSRFVGAIASGTAPASGTFNTGDVVVVQAGALLVCTAGGSPGIWASIT